MGMICGRPSSPNNIQNGRTEGEITLFSPSYSDCLIPFEDIPTLHSVVDGQVDKVSLLKRFVKSRPRLPDP